MEFCASPVRALLVFVVALFPLSAWPGGEFTIEDWKKHVADESSIDRLGRHYLEFLMEENPVNGVAYGIHGKEGDVSYYDRRLPDAAAAAAADFSAARAQLLAKLEAIDADSLSRPDQIDLHILKNQVALDQLQVTRLGALTSPLNYVTTLGQAMSGLVLRDYAPLEERLESFGARCAATGGYLDETRAALLPPGVRPSQMDKTVTQSRLAAMTGEGGLFGKTLPELLNSSGLDEKRADAILEACAAAAEEVNRFALWFKETVVPRDEGEWRLGRKLYDHKYRLQMDYPLGPDELLAEAEKWLEQKGGELVEVGRRIHDEYLADEIEAGKVTRSEGLDDQQDRFEGQVHPLRTVRSAVQVEDSEPLAPRDHPIRSVGAVGRKRGLDTGHLDEAPTEGEKEQDADQRPDLTEAPTQLGKAVVVPCGTEDAHRSLRARWRLRVGGNAVSPHDQALDEIHHRPWPTSRSSSSRIARNSTATLSSTVARSCDESTVASPALGSGPAPVKPAEPAPRMRS